MRSLLSKIFVWFWLAMALVGTAFLIASLITEAEPLTTRWRGITGDALAIYAQTSAEIYQRDGQHGVEDYLQHVERKSHIRAFFFDGDVRELSSHAAPDAVKELAARALRNDNPEFEVSAANTLAAQRVLTSAGDSYVLVLEISRGTLSDLRPKPRRALFRLGAVLLTAGLFCYWLARYLTSPIVRLRSATQRLANGDLSARVSPEIGNRRDELADLARDFDLMAERIESLINAQQRLLGDISHELRSPLARLSVALELARQSAGPDASTALDRIEREAGRLNLLIGQLLALSRLESGAGGGARERIDLTGLVQDIASDADFEAKSLKRSVRIVASEECLAYGLEELLRSAIENVVRNAVRYTREETEVEITLRREQNGKVAVIRVRDHGEGVPEAALGDLFLPFYRVADARDRQSGGTGLGLSIAERAVRLHGGSVTAANAPDGGLVVEIRLPLES
jgi:signal transduction histidine kinase